MLTCFWILLSCIELQKKKKKKKKKKEKKNEPIKTRLYITGRTTGSE